MTDQFGTRVGLAYRPAPENGEGHYLVQWLWDAPGYWVISHHHGNNNRLPFEWDFLADMIGEEEPSGRFASFAVNFIPKDDKTPAQLKEMIEAEYNGPEMQVGFKDGFA